MSLLGLKVRCLLSLWSTGKPYFLGSESNYFWNLGSSSENLSLLFLLSCEEDGAGHAYPSRSCADVPLPSSFRGGREGPSLCQRPWRARQVGGSRDRAWQHRKCWHKLIKRGIWEDWISCWFMAAAPRLPGHFFMLVHCCSWFMSESQCVGWLGILMEWMEGWALLPCQPAPIQSSSHPPEYSPSISSIICLINSMSASLGSVNIPLQASLMAQC